MSMSRRTFGQGAGATMLLNGGLARAFATASDRLTAEQVVQRILNKVASEGQGFKFPGVDTDTFKYGDPATPVTGIVFTFQATFEVLKKAVQAKKNFVITTERMFWQQLDDVRTLKHDTPFEPAGSPETEPVILAKRQYCEENGLVVWRFHDHQLMVRPDLMKAGFGLTAKLGWQDYVVQVQGQMVGIAYSIPETTLKDVARHVARSLDSRDVRVIGDPNLLVKRVGLGAHKLIEILKPLQSCDVVLMSEPQDCDAFPYLRDGISLGLPHPKGLIAITHERFEEWVAESAPAWLKPLVPEVPIEFIPAGDPYWVLPS